MKTRYAALIVVLATTLAACGGGGGGSGSAPPPANNPPANSPPNTPPANPPPATSTGASTAEITFPWARSKAVGSSVVVRGVASDPDGVADVRVNGASAALTTASASQKTRTRNASLKAGVADEGEVEWEVEVELQTGETELEVTVEDETGATTAGAAEASIEYAEVPSIFTAELGDPRLLGWSSSVTRSPAGYVTRLVQFDTASREQTIFPELGDIGIASCFRSQVNELLYIVGAVDDWQLRKFDLTARQRSDVADLSPLLTAEAGFEGPHMIELVCSSARQHAYVLATYVENGSLAKSRIVEVALSGTARVLTETDPTEPQLWLARRMTLADDELITVFEINSVAPLTSVSLADGERTALAPDLDVGGLAIAAELAQNRVYAATFEGVDEVLLTAPPTKRNISVVTPTEPLIFSQANSIAIDQANDRIIVGDSDLDALIAVDRATGVRSELLSRKLGTGPPMIAPRRLAVTASGETVYVVDDGGNAAERLFEVDLATGDRRAVGQIHDPGVNRSVPGLALDEENGYAYVARFDAGTILRVELDTESVEPIISGVGLLEGIEDIVLDAAGQRLLVADSVTDSIVAVDLVTRQQQLISRAEQRGDGPAFQTLASLTLGPEGTVVYAADQLADQILRVDLETGNREVLETSCEFGWPESLRQVLYDETTDELLILSFEGVFVHDFETSGCMRTATPFATTVLGIGLTPDGRLLAAAFNALAQIDRKSGDIVIVSK